MNISRAWAIARKEFIHIYRDPRSLGLVLLMPAILMLLFGYAVTLDVKKVKMAVLNYDGAQESQSFIDRFRGSPYFYLYRHVSNEKEMRRLIDEGAVKMGLVLPRDFSKTVKGGKTSPIQVVLDGSDSNTANIILSYVQAIAREYTQEKTFLKIERMGRKRPDPPLEGRTRIWFNEELESKNYFIPGLIAVIISIIGVLLTGQVVVREWEKGTMELLISTPVRKAELIIGKLFPYFFLGLLDLSLAVLMGKLVFQVPLRGSLSLLLVLSCIYMIVALAMGLTISAVAGTQLFANQMAMIIGFLPTFLLSGFTFVISNMPFWLQIITYAIAPRYYVTIVKEIFLKGSDFSFLWKETSVLIVMGLLGLIVATRSFKKELR
ncbi:MAG: ABC transporter permease [Deltaproteobacteria bacterium]|nr:ABC transporter permease [Deltaproteobacteria bacterium]MBM4323312.1 ABC transporter permease [Deltaproteobacteria bacterium]